MREELEVRLEEEKKQRELVFAISFGVGVLSS